MTLAKQIEGVLLAWREDLSGQFAEDAAIVVASHFQPVTADEVVERVRAHLRNFGGLVEEWADAMVGEVLEALGPAYVVTE
jgi:hypothetical protein